LKFNCTSIPSHFQIFPATTETFITSGDTFLYFLLTGDFVPYCLLTILQACFLLAMTAKFTYFPNVCLSPGNIW